MNSFLVSVLYLQNRKKKSAYRNRSDRYYHEEGMCFLLEHCKDGVPGSKFGQIEKAFLYKQFQLKGKTLVIGS